MGLWSFVRPEATTNLISNPSVETATTGYTAVAGAIARSTDEQTKGLYSLEVTPAAGVNDGVYYAITLVATTEYTFSVDVLGVTGIPYRIYIYDAGAPAILGTPITFTGDGTWRRYIVTATTGANTNCCVYVEKNNHASTGVFYIDALQVETKGYATTYCDGDQDGCSWAAGEHTSTSSRDAQSSAGGRVINLDSSGYEFEIKSSVGVGHAPIDIIDTLPAQSDGGDFQDQVARPRDFQLVGAIPGTDRADYHTNRLNLIKAFNPHRLATKQPVQLRYSVSEKSVAIDGYYASGLEKNQQAGPTVEEIALRFRAENPLFKAITGNNNGDSCGGQGALAPSVQVDVNDLNYIAWRDLDGVWQNLDEGTNGAVLALMIGSDGLLYIGGDFTQVGSVPTAANRIATYNFETDTWATLLTGFGAVVRGIIEGGIDNLIYICGDFVDVGADDTKDYLVAWNGAAFGKPYTTAPDGPVLCEALGPDGTLYIGGNFTHVDTEDTDYIAMRSPAGVWSAMGTGANNVVNDIVVDADGNVYAFGVFTDMGGVANTAYAAKWNGTAWAAMGAGFNSGVNAAAVAPDNQIYVTGAFTTANAKAASRAARWNGTDWYALGAGLGATGFGIFIPESGIVYACGNFETAGGQELPDKMAQWRGSSWAPLDIDLPPASATVWRIMYHPGRGLFVGFDGGGVGKAANASQPATNDGSANTYPIFKAIGPGQIHQLINFSTGEQILFDNLTLLDGETVTLDLRPGKKTFVSTYLGNIRGSVIHKILEGSDVESLHLIPGTNNISLLIDDATASAFLLWDVLHWSIDGVAA